MQATLPLDKMTISEKLSVMEDIWENLSHAQDTISSPEWHADVLRARELKIQEGTAKFLDLDDAKSRIWDKIK